MNKLINKKEKLKNILYLNNLFPQRLFIADKKGQILLYSYGNKKFTKKGFTEVRFGSIFKSSKNFPSRGKFFSDILTIELLISQIIIVKLSDKNLNFFDYKNIEKWNETVDKINFYNKIEMLYFADLINKEIRDDLHKIRDLRNQLAHSFHDKYFEYKNLPIFKTKHFDKFRKDIEKVWFALLKAYNNIWHVEDMMEHAISLAKEEIKKRDEEIIQ